MQDERAARVWNARVGRKFHEIQLRALTAEVVSFPEPFISLQLGGTSVPSQLWLDDWLVLVFIATRFLLIAIWMTVTPIPVLVLLVVVQLVVFTILPLILPRVLAVGAIFVLIPVVVVLVGAIVDTALVSVVALSVFLAFVVLTSVVLSGRPGRDCCGCEKCGGQGKKTQVSESDFHVVVLLRIRNPTLILAVGREAI